MTSPLNKVLCRPRQPIRTMGAMESQNLFRNEPRDLMSHHQHHHQHFGPREGPSSASLTSSTVHHGPWSLPSTKLDMISSASGPPNSERRSKSPADSCDTDPGYGTSYGSLLSSSTAGRSSSGGSGPEEKKAISEETAELTDMFVSK